MDKKSEKYYCLESKCNHKISYTNWKYGQGRCNSCANKEKHKLGILNSKGEYNGNFKRGKCYNNKCIDCENKINYYAKRCLKCGYKYLSKIRIGFLNPSWINGASLEMYPSEFNDTLKYEIRTRDNFECKNCYVTEEEHLIAYGKVLSVHHIDYNKQNCNEENLITLCQNCNIEVNINRNYWKEYFLKSINKIIADSNKKFIKI